MINSRKIVSQIFKNKSKLEGIICLKYKKEDVLKFYRSLSFSVKKTLLSILNSDIVRLIHNINNILIISSTFRKKEELLDPNSILLSYEMLWNVIDHRSELNEILGDLESLSDKENFLLIIKNEYIENDKILHIIELNIPDFLNSSRPILLESYYQYLFPPKLITSWNSLELMISLLVENMILFAYHRSTLLQFKELSVNEVMKEMRKIDMKKKQFKKISKNKLNKKKKTILVEHAKNIIKNNSA